MTNRETISWEELNAYVDGELTASRGAEIAAAIAGDRDLAARVATLSRLRAATRSLATQDEAPPLRLPAPAARRRLPLVAGMLVAAGLTAFAVIGFHGPVPGDTNPSLAAAVAAHRLWLAEGTATQRQRLGVELAGADVDTLPDLSLASLRLTHLSLDPSGRRGGGILAGYVGPNGCRVGLWIAPPDQSLPGRPAERDRDGLAIRAWRGDHASYALLARDIDPLRLERIAALVERVTRDQRTVPREQVAALAEARGVGTPCTG